MNAKIWYLYHSSFAIKTPRHFFIFDYYLDTPHGGGLSEGVINPEEIRDQDVVVFASHSHPDHYSPKIFGWRKKIGKIRYVLADQIKAGESAVKIHPGETRDLGDLSVRALDSTDLGVAFLIKADGLCIFHAGDLNWWHWEGEPERDNENMARRYQEQISLLRGEIIDIAFLPVDSRLEGAYLLGMNYFMKSVGARMAIPMHSFGNPAFYEKIKTDPVAKPYLDRIAFYRERGETIAYPEKADGHTGNA